MTIAEIIPSRRGWNERELLLHVRDQFHAEFGPQSCVSQSRGSTSRLPSRAGLSSFAVGTAGLSPSRRVA